MDGNDFYYEPRTKVTVFSTRTKANNIITPVLVSFVASGETPTRRTVTLEERCSFPLH